MRATLKQYYDNEQRIRFVATFEKTVFSHGDNYSLFQNVWVNGKHYFDHIWIKETERLKQACFKKNDVITALANISEYFTETINNSKYGFKKLRFIKNRGTTINCLQPIKRKKRCQ